MGSPLSVNWPFFGRVSTPLRYFTVLPELFYIVHHTVQ